MNRKLFWCLFILLVVSEDHCSPATERGDDVYTTLANTSESITAEDVTFGDKVEDAETAETNTRANSYEDSDDSSEDPPGPEDHLIPYSEHEDPGEPSTRPDYVAPGLWAKPDPNKNIPLEFVPTKSLAQVRGTHTVQVLPQSEAIAAATSEEERLNAPRLREVVSKKKTATIYTEEGFEDSAYDHGGHIRDADFHEGYAKKLHDQRGIQKGSGTGGKKKSKRKKLKNNQSRPKSEEFEEFSDDYSDEFSPSEKYRAEESSNDKKKDKYVNKIYRDMWKRPDVNPKIVAENEIEKLENDLKREAEETERASEDYGSKPERNSPKDRDGDYKSSEDSQYSQKTRGDDGRQTGSPSFEKKKNFYTENYKATTLEFETQNPGDSEKYEASTSSYEYPTTNQYYLSDGSEVRGNYETSTLNYNYPNNQQSVYAEAPTTVNYGDVFWRYFQKKQNDVASPGSYLQEQTTILQPFSVRETTTLEPFDEQTPPVALATINGHGPYLLVSENVPVTQNPNQYGIGGFPYFSTRQNGDKHYTPNSLFNQEYSFLNSQGQNPRPEGSFFSSINSPGPVNPGFDSLGLNNGVYQENQGTQGIPIISTEQPTTRFYDNIAFASTPTYSVITLPPSKFNPKKTRLEDDSFKKNNPFLNPAKGIVGSQDSSYKRENLGSLYNEWSPNERDSSERNREQFSSGILSEPNESQSLSKPKSHGNKGMSFFGYNPNLGYNKMPIFIEKNKNGRYSGEKSESADLNDFTIMKPPTLRQSAFSDFTLNSYPNVADYSSVSQESEAAQEIDRKKMDKKKNHIKQDSSFFHKDTHFKTPGIGNIKTTIGNRKRLFPASKLLPPPPNGRSNYGDMNLANRRSKVHEASEYASSWHHGIKNYNPDPEKLARYFRSRLSPRQTRSLDESALRGKKLANDLVPQGINARLNFTLEDQGSMDHREIGLPQNSKSRVKRNLVLSEIRSVTESSSPSLTEEAVVDEEHDSIDNNRGQRKKRSHQDLLDASHKIAGDVIDEEIDSRFRSKDHDTVKEEDNEEEEEEDEEDEEERSEKQIEIDVPDLNYLDKIQDVNKIENIPTTTTASIDFQKYPFYKSDKVSSSSPLKYIINPEEVPKKTFGGMEFYDSRDKYIQCEEIDPNLEEVLPEEEEPVPDRGTKKNLPRLRGLGDQLDCFKAKYFGENPFDNPLFFEKKINQPTPPTELDPMQLVSRILELPKDNEDYFVPAQSRKPEAMAMRRLDNNRRRPRNRILAETSNTKSILKPRQRGRNDARHRKVKNLKTEEPRTDGRRTRQRTLARKQQTTTTSTTTTTTESPDLDFVTPYQKEVYDDVMGTIKNLASLYEMIEAQTPPSLTKAKTISQDAGHILGAGSIKQVKTVNYTPTLDGKREQDFHSSGGTEAPFHEEIEGLLPPPEMNKKPKLIPYRTDKVSYNTRARTESPSRNGDKKVIGYYRTVMVHKRSLDDYAGASIGDPVIDASKRILKKRDVMDSEFVESRINIKSVDPNSSSTTEKPQRGRRRKTTLTTSTTTTIAPVTIAPRSTQAKDVTPKPVYTIRSRLRNSKDGKSTERHGLFTTTQRPSTTTDSRRNEPRYTDIARRRHKTATISTTTTTTTTTPDPQELSEYGNGTLSTENPAISGSPIEPVIESGEIYEIQNSAPLRGKISSKDNQSSSEIYKHIASDVEAEHVEEESGEDSENYEEEEEDDESTDAPVKQIRKYDVHEDVQEETTPSKVGIPKPTQSSRFVDLDTYLSTDPPGYRKFFSDESEPRDSGGTKKNHRNDESGEELVEDDDVEDGETPKNASYQESESSDEDSTESPKFSESYKDSSIENEDAEKNKEQEDSYEKPFFRYNFRPSSPSESFEDDKYSELGPRVNKPAFHHPSFDTSEFDKKYSEDFEEKEKDKTEESSESEKFVFPWAHDEEDEKFEAEDGYLENPSGKYEYPWEKRERLAKQREEKRREREKLRKLRDFSFLDDDDHFDDDEDEKKGSSSKTSGARVYPWDVYDVPSKPYKKENWDTDHFDSDRTASEIRPVTKFSSKYNSNKFKLPFAGSEPIETAKPKEIRKSVLKFLNEEDEKTIEPTVAYETAILTTSQPELLADDKKSETGKNINSTIDPVSSATKVNKRISNSRIVPESITTAPRQRSRSRVTSVRDRSTLRPVVRTTTEAAIKLQNTETPTSTTRRPLRVKGGPNKNVRKSSYKAQESQIASKIIEPNPTTLTTTSTTEKPVKPIAKFRKRVKSKTISDTAETSSRSQEETVDRSTQATTTSHRRTRPTISTRLATMKLTEENYKTTKKPEKIDAKNSPKANTYKKHKSPTTSMINSGDRDNQNPTPAGRTVEHRSRVSKEEIITKTSFPELDAAYKVFADKSSMKQINPPKANSERNRKSKPAQSTTSGHPGSFFENKESENEKIVRNESVEKLSITKEETPEHVYEKKEILDKDGHKGMFISIIPKNRTVGTSAVEDELYLKKAGTKEHQEEKEQEYKNFDETETQKSDSIEDSKNVSTGDSAVLGNILQQIPPRSNKLKETNDSNSEENVSSAVKDEIPRGEDAYGEYEGSNWSEEVEEENKTEESSVVMFEEDPSKRMYYYLDNKK